jgi:hypothetical protein
MKDWKDILYEKTKNEEITLRIDDEDTDEENVDE